MARMLARWSGGSCVLGDVSGPDDAQPILDRLCMDQGLHGCVVWLEDGDGQVLDAWLCEDGVVVHEEGPCPMSVVDVLTSEVLG